MAIVSVQVIDNIIVEWYSFDVMDIYHMVSVHVPIIITVYGYRLAT